MEELANLTPGRNGADIEAICRRAALLALREWIAPKLGMAHVQVTEATDEVDSTTPDEHETTEGTTGETGKGTGEATTPSLPATRFQIRPEHFARAIDEQRERYAVQEEAEDAIARKEEGRQRLLEMAANFDSATQSPKRGFRYWLARLLGLVS